MEPNLFPIQINFGLRKRNLLQMLGSPVCYSLTVSQIFTGAVAVITPLIYLIVLIAAALVDVFNFRVLLKNAGK